MLPELAKGPGQGIKEFKKATDDASEGMCYAIEEVLPVATSVCLWPPLTRNAPIRKSLPAPTHDLEQVAVLTLPQGRLRGS